MRLKTSTRNLLSLLEDGINVNTTGKIMNEKVISSVKTLHCNVSTDRIDIYDYMAFSTN